MRWIRIYFDVLDDLKVAGLDDRHFRIWVQLLLVAGKLSFQKGLLPTTKEIAFLIRVNVQDLEPILAELKQRKLIDLESGKYRIHAWSKRQFRSDADPTANVRKKKQRAKDVDVTRDTSVTARPPETDADSNSELSKSSSKKVHVDIIDAWNGNAHLPPHKGPLTGSAMESIGHLSSDAVVKLIENYVNAITGEPRLWLFPYGSLNSFLGKGFWRFTDEGLKQLILTVEARGAHKESGPKLSPPAKKVRCRHCGTEYLEVHGIAVTYCKNRDCPTLQGDLDYAFEIIQ